MFDIVYYSDGRGSEALPHVRRLTAAECAERGKTDLGMAAPVSIPMQPDAQWGRAIFKNIVGAGELYAHATGFQMIAPGVSGASFPDLNDPKFMRIVETCRETEVKSRAVLDQINAERIAEYRTAHAEELAAVLGSDVRKLWRIVNGYPKIRPWYLRWLRRKPNVSAIVRRIELEANGGNAVACLLADRWNQILTPPESKPVYSFETIEEYEAEYAASVASLGRSQVQR